MRLALERQRDEARRLLAALAPRVGDGARARRSSTRRGHDDAAIARQRARVAELERRARPALDDPERARLALARRRPRAQERVDRRRRRLGLRHRLPGPRPRARLGPRRQRAGARHAGLLEHRRAGVEGDAARRGREVRRRAASRRRARTSAWWRRAYGNVYVAQVALGADDAQTLKALREADAWPGPSLVIAYSTCIAHGIDMRRSMAHQRDAVRSGFWPLWRYHPGSDPHQHPFQLDSRAPPLPLRAFAETEARFAMLLRSDPERGRARCSRSRRPTPTSAGATTRSSRARAQRRSTRRRCRTRRPRTTRRSDDGGSVDAATSDSRCARRWWRRRRRSPARSTALRRLEDAGVAAVVLPSLFEEQLTRRFARGARRARGGHRRLRRGARLPARARALRGRARLAISS